MRIVVVGGTGIIGTKLVTGLGEMGYEVVAAAPETGVNTVTGEGLDDALAGASVVIDVSDSPATEESVVPDFSGTSTSKLLNAEAAAGVGHHVALSVVGADRLRQRGYFRAKSIQERLVEASPIPYSIVRATQFFELARGIAEASAEGGKVRVPPVLFQPVAAEDVARVVGGIAVRPPLNGRTEVAGPERFRMDAFFRRALPGWNDQREVRTDPRARYFGAELDEGTLLPGAGAHLGTVRYGAWPGRIAFGALTARALPASLRQQGLFHPGH